jgi:hypothetical protein
MTQIYLASLQAACNDLFKEYNLERIVNCCHGSDSQHHVLPRLHVILKVVKALPNVSQRPRRRPSDPALVEPVREGRYTDHDLTQATIFNDDDTCPVILYLRVRETSRVVQICSFGQETMY